nr:MAG TPA: hypothetical protein [Caudoviricetes sp.]
MLAEAIIHCFSQIANLSLNLHTSIIHDNRRNVKG